MSGAGGAISGVAGAGWPGWGIGGASGGGMDGWAGIGGSTGIGSLLCLSNAPSVLWFSATGPGSRAARPVRIGPASLCFATYPSASIANVPFLFEGRYR